MEAFQVLSLERGSIREEAKSQQPIRDRVSMALPLYVLAIQAAEGCRLHAAWAKDRSLSAWRGLLEQGYRSADEQEKVDDSSEAQTGRCSCCLWAKAYPSLGAEDIGA